MTHIAIVERLDGKSVDWMEKVSDEQYQEDHSRTNLSDREQSGLSLAPAGIGTDPRLAAVTFA
jgi:hypothetical protein